MPAGTQATWAKQFLEQIDAANSSELTDDLVQYLKRAEHNYDEAYESGKTTLRKCLERIAKRRQTKPKKASAKPAAAGRKKTGARKKATPKRTQRRKTATKRSSRPTSAA